MPDHRIKDDPLCGSCGAPLMDTRPATLDDRSFSRFIEGTELPVLVDFWAEWCGPCKFMAPHFAKAAEFMPGVRLAKVDTEASPQVSMRHHIRSIPTLVLFQNGKEVARHAGALQASDIVSWARTHLQ